MTGENETPFQEIRDTIYTNEKVKPFHTLMNYEVKTMFLLREIVTLIHTTMTCEKVIKSSLSQSHEKMKRQLLFTKNLKRFD